jgi:hypothetical protein
MFEDLMAKQRVDMSQQVPYLPKEGIRNFSPHLRNSAICGLPIPLRNCGQKKSCGNAIADLHNLTFAIPQLSAVSSQSILYSPFSSAQDTLKTNKNNFNNRLSQWKQKLALKGQ